MKVIRSGSISKEFSESLKKLAKQPTGNHLGNHNELWGPAAPLFGEEDKISWEYGEYPNTVIIHSPSINGAYNLESLKTLIKNLNNNPSLESTNEMMQVLNQAQLWLEKTQQNNTPQNTQINKNFPLGQFDLPSNPSKWNSFREEDFYSK